LKKLFQQKTVWVIFLKSSFNKNICESLSTPGMMNHTTNGYELSQHQHTNPTKDQDRNTQPSSCWLKVIHLNNSSPGWFQQVLHEAVFINSHARP